MTFSVRVEFLRGCYVAGRPGDRDAPEWPPHPARLFFALVAAWAEEEPRDEAERAVLAWLAAQGAPDIACSSEASERSRVIHYVPVNDAGVVKGSTARVYEQLRAAEAAEAARADAPEPSARQRRALERARTTVRDRSAKWGSVATAEGLRLLPDARGKQARTFPTAVPDDPRVVFTWGATASAEQRDLLDAVAARVSRLGHSSSQVACRVTDDQAPTPAWVPDADGPTVLRVPAAGLVELLEDDYAVHGGRDPRVLPAALAGYAAARSETAVSTPRSVMGDDWVVLARVDGPTLPVTRALALTRALRGALLAHADQPVDPVISGHQAAGGAGPATTRPLDRPHVALLPLAFVGHEHADGSVLGLAVVLPAECTPVERAAVLRAVARWREAGAELRLGRAGVVRLTVADALDPRVTLRPGRWCRPALRWTTVTPVALDRTPRHLFRGTPAQRADAWQTAGETIAGACEHVGLARPVEVEPMLGSPLAGVAPQKSFDAYSAGGGRVRRLSVHARLRFSEPVGGPVVIGAGRYLGYGLCRPSGPRQ